MTGWSLAFTMKAWGHTMFRISCRTYSLAAEVLMLNPARFSSSAMVAVPPEEDDAFVDAPLVDGVTATTDRLSAPPASAAKADRFTNPFSPMALPCPSVAPVTADEPARPPPSTQCPLSVSEEARKRNAIAIFFLVTSSRILREPAGEGPDRVDPRNSAQYSCARRPFDAKVR